jgi:hypothetical protein
MSVLISFLRSSLFDAPFLAIVLILLYYVFLRSRWRILRRLGSRNSGFCPSESLLGTALQFWQVVYRPNDAYVVEAKIEDDAEDADEGDPESPTWQLLWQLRQIRRGERVEQLVLRLGAPRSGPEAIRKL